MRTIAHISDLHFGRVESPAVEALLGELERFRPTLTVISGDLTQRARVSQYREAAAFLRRIPGPWFAVPGNHDLPLFDLVRRALRPLARWRRFVSRDVNPVWIDDELMVLGVNTARRRASTRGRISREQVERIRDRLSREPVDRPARFHVVVTHHPFLPANGASPWKTIRGGGVALESIAQWGPDLLLAGHLHRAWHGDARAHHVGLTRSVLVAQAGTTLSTRRRGEPNGYNLLTLGEPATDEPQIAIEMRDFDGTAFRESVRVVYRRTTEGWTPIASAL